MVVQRKTGRSPRLLALIGCLFLIAGGIRLGVGTSAAIAALPDLDSPAYDEGTEACNATQTPSALAQALLVRERAATERESALETKMLELEDAKARISEQLRRLEVANAALEETVAIAAQASETDLEQLTAVYEAMKPAEAADLFSQMPADFASGFLGRMSPVAAAGILAGLEPEVAYSMSAHLAGRNALAPTE